MKNIYIYIIYFVIFLLYNFTLKAQFVTIRHSEPFSLEPLVEVDSVSYPIITDSLIVNSSKIISDSLKYHLPMDSLYITSNYGYRLHPITNIYEFHNGVDLRGKNSPVYAIFNGTVTKISYDIKSGIHIIITSGLFSFSYSHLSFIFVKENSFVKAGTIIGRSGNTGSSTAPHLHFVVRYNNKVIDPVYFINFLKKLR